MYVNADATQLPFENECFDLITSYLFLTRMTADISNKVLKEWLRVLKKGGKVLATIDINGDKRLPVGNFYRTINEDMGYAMGKVEKFIECNKDLGEEFSEHMKKRTRVYLENTLNVAIPSNEYVMSMFKGFLYCDIKNVNSPAVLQEKEKIAIVKAVK